MAAGHRFRDFAAPESGDAGRLACFAQLLRRKLTLLTQMYRALNSPASGNGFTNTGPTGEADDIVLAHGSLVSGMLFLDLTPTPPTLKGDQVGTFIPNVAEFFKGGSELLPLTSPLTRPRS